MEKILVLFKTHLDVGFTNLAKNVVEKYNKIYIPRAIQVARDLAESGCEEGFVWTTGSWILYQYIEQANPEEKAQIEEALQKRWIRWHALPVTMHSEAADRDLYAYSLRLSQELDARYGGKSIAGKFTDVPGHTRAIVPLLAQAGIELLHIGVNPGSTPPDIPAYFRWIAPGGEEITMMYSKGDYGDFSVIPGTETGVLFAYTGDNCGPSSAEHIRNIYAQLHRDYPEAVICAADLNDVAMEIRKVREYLPKIYQEIGDTWIHGTGCAPTRISRYRALLRYAKTLPADERDALYSRLFLVPEHTWGRDEKTFLHDQEHFSREQFAAARGEENFRMMEESWREQDAYLTEGVERMQDPAHREEAYRVMQEDKIARPAFDTMTRLDTNQASLGAWNLTWDETGAIVHADKNGQVYADASHPLAVFRYEVFTEQDVMDFQSRYITKKWYNAFWTLHDFGKPELSKAVPTLTEHVTAGAVLRAAYRNGDQLVFDLHVTGEAADVYGCPSDMALLLSVTETGSLLFDFAWFDKPAMRIPEALWLGFCPVHPLTGISKLGSVIHPLEVLSGGNREMHAAEDAVYFEDYTLHLVDSMLLAVGKPSCYGFYNEYPDTSRGIWANLFNNQWGTNFTMWCEGDNRFRFVLD